MNLIRDVVVTVAMVGLSVVGGGIAGGQTAAASSQGASLGPRMQAAISSINAVTVEELATPAAASTTKKIQFDHFMVDPADPNFIIPCVRVAKQLYKAAQREQDVAVVFRITYTSNGNSITKSWVVPLDRMRLTTHHPQPSNRKFLLVDTTLDISDAPIDSAESASATIRLVDYAPTRSNSTFLQMP